jgi:sulfocyanin SoxE-like protein
LRTASAATLLATLLLAGAAPATAARPNPAQFIVSSTAHKLVKLTLLAGLGGANNGFNFDGYGRGELQVRVPLGWRVVVDCENRGGMRHSCAIVQGSLATAPAFHGASTKQPIVGLSPGAKATFSFTAARTGSFRIACLVPGHEQARMWDVLVVARGGRPSISVRPGP